MCTVTADEFTRIEEAFKRWSSNTGYLPQVTFQKDVITDAIPGKLAEVWVYICAGMGIRMYWYGYTYVLVWVYVCTGMGIRMYWYGYTYVLVWVYVCTGMGIHMYWYGYTYVLV